MIVKCKKACECNIPYCDPVKESKLSTEKESIKIGDIKFLKGVAIPSEPDEESPSCQEKDKRIQSLEAKLKVAVGLLEDISLQCECNSCNVACSEEFAVTCVEWKARAALKEIVE